MTMAQTAVKSEVVVEQEDLLDKVLAATVASLDRKATAYSERINDPSLPKLSRAMILATAIDLLGKAITPQVMAKVLELQDTPLGFMTDRKREGGYESAIVKECLIAALLSGVYPTGNEFNIISGRMYITQNGYRRKVREINGLKNLRLSPGVPFVHNGQTVVRFAASWLKNGVEDQLMGPDGKPGLAFAVRVNQNMGADGVIGKATRKALKAIFEQVCGSDLLSDDGEVGESCPLPAAVFAADPVPPVSRSELVEKKLTRISQEQESKLAGMFRTLNMDNEMVDEYLREYQVPVISKLSPKQFVAIVGKLETLLEKVGMAKGDANED